MNFRIKMVVKHIFGIVLLISVLLNSGCKKTDADKTYSTGKAVASFWITDNEERGDAKRKCIDTSLFNFLQMHLVHDKPTQQWPVPMELPLPGALLPFNRIVAYYGNFYSKGMGILGELPEDEMLSKLRLEVNNWEAADPKIPVLPAIHYIAVTAQGSPGKDAKYRLRMPFAQIDRALEVAKKVNGIVFLDVQVGHSTLEEELPVLEPYLKLPNVHLGIDPEYSMKGGERPCAAIGYFDGADIDYAVRYLQETVKKYDLPPKILVVHRFTKGMVINYKKIKLCPEVQVVVHMDGFGFPEKKKDSYRVAVTNEPIQFGGFKLFYKNDKIPKPFHLMAPKEILALYPSPIYIQYQ